jgi:hypothetical protein
LHYFILSNEIICNKKKSREIMLKKNTNVAKIKHMKKRGMPRREKPAIAKWTNIPQA